MPNQINRLKYLNFEDSTEILWNLSAPELIEKTIFNGQGTLTFNGALSVDTGEFKGRSPQDRFIVKDEITSEKVWWNDDLNLPFESVKFDALHNKIVDYLAGKKVFIRDAFACADLRYRKSLRIITEFPWSNLFAFNMFIRPTQKELEEFSPEWHIICAPDFLADHLIDGTRQHNFSIINFKKKIIIIGGTGFTGEIKKGVFTVLNFLLPTEHNVLPMHCSANVGETDDTAIFFGLSGTGKTTLSSDPNRKLIGDDEHGWSDSTIFNFEGGCYAKTINLTKDREPQIFDSIKFGSLLENINFKSDRITPDYFNDKKTENTRVSYPLYYVDNIVDSSIGKIPNNIFFLTCDAFGVLPPISKLNKDQAAFYFINGYSAKIPGSEIDTKEPSPVFSSCFGAPFLLLHPKIYAEMLINKLDKYNTNVWLVNTGWTGGQFGVGERINLIYSRKIITAVLDRSLENVQFTTNNVFNLATPVSCKNVPSKLLDPTLTWKNKNEYYLKAEELKHFFDVNSIKLRN